MKSRIKILAQKTRFFKSVFKTGFLEIHGPKIRENTLKKTENLQKNGFKDINQHSYVSFPYIAIYVLDGICFII